MHFFCVGLLHSSTSIHIYIWTSAYAILSSETTVIRCLAYLTHVLTVHRFKYMNFCLASCCLILLLSWKIVVVVIFWLMLQAVVNFITMQLQLCSVFFTFSLGTKSHYFGRTILHGGARVCSIILFVEYLLFVFSAVECVTIIFLFLLVSSHWSWICSPPY